MKCMNSSIARLINAPQKCIVLREFCVKRGQNNTVLRENLNIITLNKVIYIYNLNIIYK